VLRQETPCIEKRVSRLLSSSLKRALFLRCAWDKAVLDSRMFLSGGAQGHDTCAAGIKVYHSMSQELFEPRRWSMIKLSRIVDSPDYSCMIAA
jgi:hypothetical protein